MLLTLRKQNTIYVHEKENRKKLKKTKKSVDKKGSPWYYIQALERDGKKLKAKSLKGKPLEREHRTLKIKQREKEWNL